MKNPVSDQEWKDAIIAYRDGNEQPFLYCIKKYKPYFIQASFIKSKFSQIKDSGSSIEDLFQETITKFWENFIVKHKTIPDSCNSYLGTMATNKIYDLLKEEKKKKGEKLKKRESEEEKRKENEEEAKRKADIKRKEEKSDLFNEVYKIKSFLEFNDNFFLEIKNEKLTDSDNDLQQVIEAFNKLGQHCRIILGAHYIWGMRYDDIDEKWGIRNSNPKAATCRNKLRGKL